MDPVDKWREQIAKIIMKRTEIPYSHGKIESIPVFDTENDRYLLMVVGWDGYRRIHGCVIHLDIIDGKIFIQRDGTEDGLYTELIEAGISPNDIVLAFRYVDEREIETIIV